MKLNSMIVAGVVAASTAVFGIAQAEVPGGDEGKSGLKRSSLQRGDKPDPGARVEKRLSRLRNELKVTPQQEPLWNAFAEKSEFVVVEGMQARRDSSQDDQQLTAPERMAQMQSRMTRRLAAMQSVSESFNRLYSALSPEQKAMADKHFSHAERRHHRPVRGGRNHDRQGTPGTSESRKG